jgi:hypothetical protein
MIPRLQTSTLGPYSLRVTTSGAIQYGVPTIVVRFAFAGSEIRAQNPKSAVRRLHQMLAQPSVTSIPLTELDVTRHTQEDVIALDISMDHAVRVQMSQTLGSLSADGGNLTLSHDVASDNIGQTSTFHVLHNDPKIALVEERVDIVDDVGMSRRFHHQNLVDDEVLLWLLLEVHLFDRYRYVRTELIGGVDTSRRTARTQEACQQWS